MDPRPYYSKYSSACRRNKRCARTCNVTNTHSPSSNTHTVKSKAFGSRNCRMLNEQTDTQCKQLRMGCCPSPIQNERPSFGGSYVHETDGPKSQCHVILFLAPPVFGPTQLPNAIYRVTNMVNHGVYCPSRWHEKNVMSVSRPLRLALMRLTTFSSERRRFRAIPSCREVVASYRAVLSASGSTSNVSLYMAATHSYVATNTNET